mgnify:CR=1 FL=1
MADRDTELTGKLLVALEVWREYVYGGTVDFPPDVKGVPSKLIRTGTRQIDCSTFTWGLLTEVFPDAPWSFDYYKRWQMWDRKDMWGPTRVAEELGIAKDEHGDGWYLYQVWKGQWEGGHSFLGLARDGRLLVLEATRSRRNGVEHNGVVWRGVGPAGSQLPELPEYCEHEATRGLVFSKIKLT